MSEIIHLQVVTSTDKGLLASITELYIPAYFGEAGVLENHKPYISLLKSGEISYKDIKGKKFYLFIREGFLEVLDNKVSILSDSVEKGESLNKQEIEEKLTELDKRIKSSLTGEISPEELEEALEEQKEFKAKRTIIQKIEEGR